MKRHTLETKIKNSNSTVALTISTVMRNTDESTCCAHGAAEMAKCCEFGRDVEDGNDVGKLKLPPPELISPVAMPSRARRAHRPQRNGAKSWLRACWNAGEMLLIAFGKRFRNNLRADKPYRGFWSESTIPCAVQSASSGCGVPTATLRSHPSNAVSARSHCMRWRSFLSRTRRRVSSSTSGSRSKVTLAG